LEVGLKGVMIDDLRGPSSLAGCGGFVLDCAAAALLSDGDMDSSFSAAEL
jgi:hypothetical protein